MIVRSLLIWLVILFLANLNGLFRQTILIPRMSDIAAHVVSTLLLSALVFLAAWLALAWIGPVSLGEAWTIGLLWLLLTLAFEFIAEHYLFGNPWEKLLADYDIAHGRIWPLALLTALLAPVITFVLRRYYLPPLAQGEGWGGVTLRMRCSHPGTSPPAQRIRDY